MLSYSKVIWTALGCDIYTYMVYIFVVWKFIWEMVVPK